MDHEKDKITEISKEQLMAEETDEEYNQGVHKESQRVMRIKVYVTVFAILAIAAIAVIFWNDSGGYQFKISTDEGYAWQCEIEDESIIKISSSTYEKGKFICDLEGVSAGKTKVNLTCFEENNPENIIEKRAYSLTVTDDLYIIQNSVERDVLQ